MPPATPKLALACDGVPVIHPPPVTKWHGGGLLPAGGGVVGQVMAADEEATTTSTPAQGTMRCRALTVMPAIPATCSLMITKPPLDRKTNWLACPVTAIAWPLITSPVTSTTALTAAPFGQSAETRDITKSATMVVARNGKPAQPVKLTLATEASDSATVPPATMDACETPKDSPPARLASSADASWAPPVRDSGPVLARETPLPITNPATADACPWKVVELAVPKAPKSSCACTAPVGKQHNRPARRLRAAECGIHELCC